MDHYHKYNSGSNRWHFTSSSYSTGTTTKAWPTADFVGGVSASMSITGSNPYTGSQHIRIFIPLEDISGAGAG